MDVNGLRSFGLSFDNGLQAWPVPGDAGTAAISVEPVWSHRIAGVRLASRAHGLVLREDATSVDEVVLQPSMAVDSLGNHVRWDAQGLTSISHLAAQHQLAPRSFELPEQAQPVSDITVGTDDVLYLAANSALWLVDLRGRFELTQLLAPDGFKPQRLASCPSGGVWVLDVEQGALARVLGLPLFTQPLYTARNAASGFVAQDPNPNPPRWQPLAGRLPVTEKAVAIASNGRGTLLVLSLTRPAGGAWIRTLLNDGRLSLPLALAGPRLPHTLGWLDPQRIAVATRGQLVSASGQMRDPGVYTYALPDALLARLSSASGEHDVVLPQDIARPLLAQGDYYPLANWTGGPFVSATPALPLHYPRHADAGVEPAKVARVSNAARASYGLVINAAAGRSADARVLASLGLLDTRDPATVWHRLYAEAVVPAGCAMIVWLAVSDTGPPEFAAGAPGRRARWYPHVIGERTALPPAVLDSLPVDTPRAAWVKEPTEVAHGQSVLCCAPEAATRDGRAGLFTVLIQRAAMSVRALQGPRLWVAVELFGDGRATPELVALRAYAGRVSYRDRYLPALYHERVFGEEAQRPGRATGADFLDRFLHLFEGLFSDIEGRIAASALVTDAMACPPDALPWLASWIGMSLEPGLPLQRARWMLANAAQLARRHGTLAGLQLALDIATDGAVTRGRIVVVEDFRLRRTLSTILGAQLEDSTDPLTSGIARSGNSVLGDSLFLGDAKTLQDDKLKTFLALFRRIDADSAAARTLLQRERVAAHHALFDELSHRVTVLVHEELPGDELGLVQRLAELGAPAHVLVRVVRAAYPFMVGVASLIGADTFLRAAPLARPVRVGPGEQTSSLGSVDTLRGEASLDAHAGAFESVLAPGGSGVKKPVARIAAIGLPDSGIANVATPFQLDASASSADTDHVIDSFNWSHLPPT
jgi:phage tail-like protein